MAVLNIEKLEKIQGIEAVEYDKVVNLAFQLNVSKAQKNSGILGKVLIFHPAFTTRATLFKSANGIIRVSGSSMKTANGDWFNIVTLHRSFRDYIIREYKKEIAGENNETPWYEKMKGSVTKVVNSELVNESLDIESINLLTNLSDKQIETNMLCKVTVSTSIATLRSFSVYKSKFGPQLYGMAQNEDSENTIPAYTLSRECEAQVFNIIHPLVNDWDKSYKKEMKKTVEDAVGEEVPDEYYDQQFESSLYD